jgi:hypothetical protein
VALAAAAPLLDHPIDERVEMRRQRLLARLPDEEEHT